MTDRRDSNATSVGMSLVNEGLCHPGLEAARQDNPSTTDRPVRMGDGGDSPDVELRLAQDRRIHLEPEPIEPELARLVLAIMALLRQLLENQTHHRRGHGSPDDAEIERVRMALLRAEGRLDTLCRQSGLRPEDLDLDLRSLGLLFDQATLDPTTLDPGAPYKDDGPERT